MSDIEIELARQSERLRRAAMLHDALPLAELLEAGADIEARGAHGWTALHFSAQYGTFQVAEELLRRGANPNRRDHNGNTALLLAAAKMDRLMIRMFVDAGADVTARNNHGETARDLVREGYGWCLAFLRRPEDRDTNSGTASPRPSS